MVFDVEIAAEYRKLPLRDARTFGSATLLPDPVPTAPTPNGLLGSTPLNATMLPLIEAVKPIMLAKVQLAPMSAAPTVLAYVGVVLPVIDVSCAQPLGVEPPNEKRSLRRMVATRTSPTEIPVGAFIEKEPKPKNAWVLQVGVPWTATSARAGAAPPHAPATAASAVRSSARLVRPRKRNEQRTERADTAPSMSSICGNRSTDLA